MEALRPAGAAMTDSDATSSWKTPCRYYYAGIVEVLLTADGRNGWRDVCAVQQWSCVHGEWQRRRFRDFDFDFLTNIAGCSK